MCCWSDLPQELLEKIIQENKENDISYVARIRAVCKSWRSCIPSPNLHLKPPSPFLASFPFPFTEEPEYDLVAALEVVVIALHPLEPNNPNGGILKLKQKKSGKLRAMHPLTHKECVSNRGTTVSEVVNLLDYRVQLLHRCHYVEDRYSEYRCVSIHKVVVIGDMICALYDHDNTDNFWLTFLKFGEKQWEKFEGDFQFQDITIYGDNFFAVDDFGVLFMIDPLSLRVTQIVERRELREDDCDKYLVESLGDLFLVGVDERRVYNPIIEVYKLHKAEGRWIFVGNLGNKNFFVCDRECSFSISDEDFCGVCKKWNCVYCWDLWCDDKCTVRRGLSTEHAYLYNYDCYGRDERISSCPDAMDVFWNHKPRKRSTKSKGKVFWNLKPRNNVFWNPKPHK